MPAVTSRSSMRDAATVRGRVPYLPANSVTAVFMALVEPTALVTRDEAMVEKTLGTMTTARMAIMARTPIISTRLKPAERRDGGKVRFWVFFMVTKPEGAGNESARASRA